MTARERTGAPWLLLSGAAAALAALVLMLVGTYVDNPLKKQGNRAWSIATEGHGPAELALLVAFALAGALVVFGVVVTRGLRRDAARTARWSLAAAVAGFLSLAVFWAGLPVILAAGSAVLGLSTRERTGRLPLPAAAALALSALTAVSAVWLALAG